MSKLFLDFNNIQILLYCLVYFTRINIYKYTHTHTHAYIHTHIYIYIYIYTMLQIHENIENHNSYRIVYNK